MSLYNRIKSWLKRVHESKKHGLVLTKGGIAKGNRPFRRGASHSRLVKELNPLTELLNRQAGARQAFKSLALVESLMRNHVEDTAPDVLSNISPVLLKKAIKQLALLQDVTNDSGVSDLLFRMRRKDREHDADAREAERVALAKSGVKTNKDQMVELLGEGDLLFARYGHAEFQATRPFAEEQT